MQRLTVQYPTEEVELLPIARPQLKHLKALFVELQSYWAEYVFSVGDVMADDHCWELMGKIAFLLPQAKNAALTGFDLDALSNDYEQIESLFLCRGKGVEVEAVHNYSLARFRMDLFEPCQILALHKFNHERLLEAAEDLRKERVKQRVNDRAKPSGQPKPGRSAVEKTPPSG